MRLLLAALLILGSTFLSGDTYPTDYFRSPVGIPILLSGSFGEMRSNHFHSGLDIRTNGREGYRVYAAGDGYVSRIAVSPTGFGNALYVTHPNGFATVYGHLQRFDDAIADYVRARQYEERTFAVDLYPPADRFPVRKGDVIAISGNSGSSGGPHLHFEIRDAQTEQPINPLLFGIPLRDSQSPQIRRVRLYVADASSYALVTMSDGRSTQVTYGRPATFSATGGGSRYRLAGVSRIEAVGRIGLGVELRDTHDGSGYRLGAYRVQLLADETLLYGYEFETFAFHESRYINAHVDYDEWARSRRWIQRAHRLPGNRLPIYLTDGDGWLQVEPGAAHALEYRIEDVFGNTSRLAVQVSGRMEGQPPAAEPIPYATVVPQTRPHVFTDQGIALTFPAEAVYDDLPLRYRLLGAAQDGFSDVHEIHDRFTPLHSAYSLSVRADRLPARLRDKAVVVLQDDERPDRRSSLGGSYENGYVTTRTRSFGRVYVTADTLAPTIRPQNITPGRSMRGQRSIRLLVDDELSGLDAYDGFVNDEWVLFSFDAKRNLMEYTFDDRVPPGQHRLRFVARDRVGNEAVYTVDFSR